MAEIVLGLLAIAAAAGIATGYSDALLRFPLGSGGVITALLLGSALVLRGLYRLLRQKRSGSAYELRSAGLVGAIAGVTIVIALTMPALAETLNVLTIAGFPFGLYMLGQGTLILFVALLFVFAARHSRIDAGDP